VARQMLDSDVCFDLMRRRSPKARWRLERSKPGEVAISSIVAAELWTGAAKSREPDRAAQALREFLCVRDGA
jgi:predicted nucleic acid-binding protein